MPRVGDVYAPPAGTNGVPNFPIESLKYNNYIADITQDLNTPRPISAGGTGASDPINAMLNLGGEFAKQLVDDYNTFQFTPGSFYSTGAPFDNSPVSGHAFAGICYVSGNAVAGVYADIFLEARDQTDTAIPGPRWARQKKAGTWNVWKKLDTSTSTTTPGADAADNSFWWDPTIGKLFYRYNDGNSTQWVEAVAVPDIDPNNFVELTGDTMSGALNVSVKGSTFGSAIGTSVSTTPPVVTDANLLVYHTGASNWGGVGADVDGNLWVRAGTSGTPASALYVKASSNRVYIAGDPVDALGVATKQYVDAATSGATGIGRAYLSGNVISISGSTFQVNSGIADDVLHRRLILKDYPLNKTMGSWAAGNGFGALDTGAIAANTWYHVFIIGSLTLPTDVLISILATGPTLPASYDVYRRVGSIKTDGTAANFLMYTQLGDEFLWSTPVTDHTTTILGTASSAIALASVPTFVPVQARIRFNMVSGTAGTGILINSMDETSTAVNTPAGNRNGVVAVAGLGTTGELQIRTNGNQQIRAVATAASTTLTIATFGWFDRRGRDD